MRKALIVVDFQNDFVNGTLGFEGAELLDTIIEEKIKLYQKEGYDVIYTFDTHSQDYMNTEEGRNLPIIHCIKGTNGHQLYGKVGKCFDKTKDIYFEKPTFPSLELANYLNKVKYDEIEVCGLVSNICVLSNVIMVKAALPNAKILVDKKATDSFDKELNEKTFDILKGIHVEVL